jgi:hypothetical protein
MGERPPIDAEQSFNYWFAMLDGPSRRDGLCLTVNWLQVFPVRQIG